MTPGAQSLLAVAEQLDTEPTELLNGGASKAHEALFNTATERDAVAAAQGLDAGLVQAVWDRADAAVRDIAPSLSGVELFTAASEAASALYVAAWLLDAPDLTAERIQDLM